MSSRHRTENGANDSASAHLFGIQIKKDVRASLDHLRGNLALFIFVHCSLSEEAKGG